MLFLLICFIIFLPPLKIQIIVLIQNSSLSTLNYYLFTPSLFCDYLAIDLPFRKNQTTLIYRNSLVKSNDFIDDVIDDVIEISDEKVSKSLIMRA